MKHRWLHMLTVALASACAGCAITYLLGIIVDARYLFEPLRAIGVLVASILLGCLLYVALQRMIARYWGIHDEASIQVSTAASLLFAPVVFITGVFSPHLSGNLWMVVSFLSPTSPTLNSGAVKVVALVVACVAAQVALTQLFVRPGRWKLLNISNRSRASVSLTVWLAVIALSVAFPLFVLPMFEKVRSLDHVRGQRFHLPPPEEVSVTPGVEFVWRRLQIDGEGNPVEMPVFAFPGAGEIRVECGRSHAPYSKLEYSAFLAHVRSTGDDSTSVFADPLDDRGARIVTTVVTGGGTPRRTEHRLARSDTGRPIIVDWNSGLGEEVEVKFTVEPDPDTQVLLEAPRCIRRGATPKHVLLLSLDTHALRHMSLAGNNGVDTNPFLRELVDDDPQWLLFTGSVASSNWTLPSHATMFTGVYPSQHGLCSTEPVTQPSEDLSLLSEILAKAGVESHYLISHTRLHSRYGYYRGVTRMQQFHAPLGDRGRQLLKNALEYLEASRDRDTFMVLHLFDAHSPYTNGPMSVARNASGDVEPSYPADLYDGKLYLNEIYGARGWHLSRRAENIEKYGPVFKPRMPGAKAAYQVGLRDVDDMLREFVGALKSAGLYDDAAILVVSDHGEEFFDHGLLTHTSLYEENIRVPFLLKLPRTWRDEMPRGARNGRTVANRFEAHTTVFKVVLDLFAAPYPDYLARMSPHGLSLTQLVSLSDDQPSFSELHITSDDFYEISSVVDGRYKVILSFESTMPSDELGSPSAVQVYDLQSDPTEANNLFSFEPERFQQMVTSLGSRATQIRERATSPVAGGGFSPEEVEMLRALGYLQDSQ